MTVIAFTGQDGTGKSTQIARVRQRLEREGRTVAAVHQYRPQGRLGRAIGPLGKRWANRAAAPGAADGVVAAPGAGRAPLSARLSVLAGWRRSRATLQSHAGVDVLLLDRCFIDELIRAAHKFGREPALGWWLLRRGLPRPDLVIAFTLDPATGWRRKKTRELTLEAYRSKEEHIRRIVRRAGEIWPIEELAVDDRGEDDMADRVWSLVRRVLDVG